MGLLNVAGKIGKACGERYGDLARYADKNGWTKAQRLSCARSTAAQNLMRAFFAVHCEWNPGQSADWRVLANRLSSIDSALYEQYQYLFQRADWHLLKAYQSRAMATTPEQLRPWHRGL